MLTAGSYITCNDLRSKCRLGWKAIYNTEILVWGEVPAQSIICRWPRSEIYRSGLLDVFPSLGKLERGLPLDGLRRRLSGDFSSISSTKVASALVYLGMEPSHFQIKQVFIFLLGQASGYSVEKVLGNVEAQLEATLSPVIGFEQASHELTRKNYSPTTRMTMRQMSERSVLLAIHTACRQMLHTSGDGKSYGLPGLMTCFVRALSLGGSVERSGTLVNGKCNKR
jgi:hypothetical protein